MKCKIIWYEITLAHFNILSSGIYIKIPLLGLSQKRMKNYIVRIRNGIGYIHNDGTKW